MSHEIDTSNNRANIAYANGTETPWHGLGFKIDADASVEAWRKAAGLDWTIRKGVMHMEREDGQMQNVSGMNRSVLYRDDTNAPLSVMSTKNYHVVQPDQILDFIGSSVKAMGWKMDTAGSLKGGKKIWALASLGGKATIGKGDDVEGYLLAATACDGSMASEFMFTTVRVVCQNTMHMAVEGYGRDDGSQPRVKVYHFNKLDVSAVKEQLGIAGSVWENFIANAKRLAAVKLTDKKAIQVLRTVYTKPAEKDVAEITDDQFIADNMNARRVLELYKGKAMGSELVSAAGTAWGLVNAATEFYDHASISRSTDNRLNSAWFGAGANMKEAIYGECLKVAA